MVFGEVMEVGMLKREKESIEIMRFPQKGC